MRMNKYGRELELIILLTNETPLTALQISERLGITRRNLVWTAGQAACLHLEA